jgi:hypothetical protein
MIYLSNLQNKNVAQSCAIPFFDVFPKKHIPIYGDKNTQPFQPKRLSSNLTPRREDAKFYFSIRTQRLKTLMPASGQKFDKFSFKFLFINLINLASPS